MFGNAFGWPHLIVILLVILLIFGATRLPALSKSLGQSMRIFRKEVKAMKEDDVAAPSQPSAAPTTPTESATAHETGTAADTSVQAASVPEGQNKPKQ